MKILAVGSGKTIIGEFIFRYECGAVEDNDRYTDEQHYDYEPKFCPKCSAKVESCIKTPKGNKPLYTLDEIYQINGVEFNPR